MITRKDRMFVAGNKELCCLLAFFSVCVRTINAAQPNVDEKCDYNQLQNCSSAFDSVASNFDLTFPNSKEKLNSICVQLSNGFNCVDRYVTACYKINHQILYQVAVRGAKSTTKHLCKTDSLALEFLTKPNSCFQSTNFSRSNCGNYLESTTEVLNSDKDIEAEGIVRTICCSWNSFVNCKAKSVEENCGEDESNWIRLLFQNISGELVLSHCYGYNSDIWKGCSKASFNRSQASNRVLLILAFCYTYSKMLLKI